MKVTYVECPNCGQGMVFLYENGYRAWWCRHCGLHLEANYDGETKKSSD